MVKDNDEAWTLPQRKPITKAVLDHAIDAEERAASREHQAREAWFDRQHGTVMLKLTDGRVFGAEPGFIPSLQGASAKQLTVRRRDVPGHRAPRPARQRGRPGDADYGRVAAGHQTVRGTPGRAHDIAGQSGRIRAQRATWRPAEVQAEDDRAAGLARAQGRARS